MGAKLLGHRGLLDKRSPGQIFDYPAKKCDIPFHKE